MKQIINIAAGLAMGVVWLVLVGFILYSRFSNVDMSETRLFLSYAREYVAGVLLLLVLSFVYRKTQ